MKVRKKNGLRAGVLLLCLCFLFSALAVPTFADEVSTAPSETPETLTASSEASETSSAPSEAPETLTASSEVSETSSAPSEEPEEPTASSEVSETSSAPSEAPEELTASSEVSETSSAPSEATETLTASSEVSETSSAPSEAPESAESRDGIVDSGTWKENIEWTLDENGVLTISGTGRLIPSSGGHAAAWFPWFEFKEKINAVVVENGITGLGQAAFSSCDNLTEISLPSSVIGLGTAVFGGSMFTQIELPPALQIISNLAFVACSNLKEITIPGKVESIDNVAFKGCSSLKTVKFLGDAPEIANDAFLEDTLTAYYPLGNTTWTEEVMQDYGGTITWVAYDPDSGESIVDSGTCGENLTWTLDENGVLTISGTGEMESYSSGDQPWDDRWYEVLSVKIEEGITSIADRAFAGMRYLTSVTVPDTVTSIGEYAFSGCYDLNEITMPDGIVHIGEGAFTMCYGLETLILPESLTEISAYFINAPAGNGLPGKLKYVEIPERVTKIGRAAFVLQGELESVKFRGDAPEIADDAFSYDTLTAYYPAGNATWTKEVMQDYGGTITWVAYDPDSGATSAPEPTEKPAEDLSYMLKIEGEDGIRITEGLKAAGVETPEQVKEKLLACVVQNEGYTAENTDLFEVTLRVSKDDGYTWGDVSADSFPESGEVRVTLPYPKGAPLDTPKENYKVYHMFTQDVNGHKAGEIEACPVEKIDEGLVVTLHGLSPVMVAWKPVDEAAEPTAAPSTEPTSAPSAEPTEQPKPTAAPSAEPTATPTEQPAGDAPKTGDNGVHVLWIAAVLLSGGAMTALVWAKRKKQ